ncbi:MAG: amino acid racemase [Bacteroidales bacterium]|nr:amino acid racemase [Bacteroidales bacterium]
MVVGVIGAAGVAATNKLCELIEVKYTRNGAFRDCHHPEMIIYQATQAPSRSMYLEGKGPSYIDDYVNVGTKLKNAGADTICMCCNTAHYALPEIESKVGVKFINLIAEVALKCKQSGAKRVGLVASDGCLGGKVYERYFAEICPEVELVYPEPVVQKNVTKGICNVKNMHRFEALDSPERPARIFDEVRVHLLEKGCDTVVMGCTDIRVDYHSDDANVIDSLEVLADKIYYLTKDYYGK